MRFRWVSPVLQVRVRGLRIACCRAVLGIAAVALLADVQAHAQTTTNSTTFNITSGAETGTQNLTGNFVQTASGHLTVKAGGASADRLNVSGSATLSGFADVTLVFQGVPLKDGTTYTFLTGSPVSGSLTASANPLQNQFLRPDPRGYAFWDIGTTCTGTECKVVFTRKSTFIKVVGLENHKGSAPTDIDDEDDNKSSIARLADRTYAKYMRGESIHQAMTFFLALHDILTPSGVGFIENFWPEGTDSNVIGNQLLANLATGRMVQGAVNDRLAALRDGTTAIVERAAGLRELQFNGGSRGAFDVFASAGAFAAPGAGSAPARSDAVWLQGIGAWQRVSTDGNTPGLKQDTYGLIGGIDINPFRERFPDFKGGIWASYTHSRLFPGSENGTTDGYRAGVYGTHPIGAAYWEASAGYGRLNMTATRSVDFFGLFPDVTATGRTSGDEWSAMAGLGYRLWLGKTLIEPAVRLAYMRETRNAFTETGADIFNFSYEKSSIDSLQASAGVRVQSTFDLGRGLSAKPELRVRYLRDLRDATPNMTVFFDGAPDLSVNLLGVRTGRDAAQLGAAITVANQKSFALFANYDAELRKYESVQTVRGGARWQW